MKRFIFSSVSGFLAIGITPTAAGSLVPNPRIVGNRAASASQKPATSQEFDFFLSSLKKRLSIDDWTLTFWGLDHGLKEFFTQDDLEKLRKYSAEIEPVVLGSLREGRIGATMVAAYLRYPSALPILKRKLLELREPYYWEGPDYRREESYLDDAQYPYQQTYIEAIEAISRMPLRKAIHLSAAERLVLKRRANRARPDADDQQSHCAKWLLAKFSNR